MDDNKPPCERCHRALGDGSTICIECTKPVDRLLAQVAAAAGEASTTIARLDVLGDTGGGTPEPEIDPAPKSASALTSTALPVDLDASTAHRTAVRDLMMWVRTVSWQRGVALPTAQTHQLACTHAICGPARRNDRRRAPGPPCSGVPVPATHPLALVAGWLSGQLGWLRHLPEADRALAGIEEACKAILAVVDRKPDRWSLGPCGAALEPIVLICVEDLRPVSGARTVWCKCGAEWDVEARKRELLDRLDDTWLGATKATHMLRWLGEEKANAATIRGWARKGWLMAHPKSLPGQPEYRLGSIRELIRIERQRKAAYAARDLELAEVRKQKTGQAEQPQEAMSA